MSHFVFHCDSCSGSITTVGEERAYLSAIVTCNYVVSVRRGFLFFLVLGMGCVILLWHFLGIPYNYLVFIVLNVRDGIESKYPSIFIAYFGRW